MIKVRKKMSDKKTTYNHAQSPLMADILAIRDHLWAESAQNITMIAGELSHEFALADPALAALYKDLQSMKAEMNHARKTGQMTVMATWRFESAESAYHTRLIEVKRNKMIADAKARMKETDSQAVTERKELHALTMQQKMNDEFAALREKRLQEKKKKESGAWSWIIWFMVGYWLARMNDQRLKRTRDALSAFSPRSQAIQ